MHLVFVGLRVADLKSTCALQAGPDHIFLPKLFARMHSGAMGPLDTRNLILRGWSGGAQMVSWLFEVFAWRNGTFPSYVRPVGGVMLSGGSYTCYNDPHDPMQPVAPQGSCKDCVGHA